MTFEERVRALEPLGLRRRQAEFLVTVALHGGYCLQRQYDAFAGRRHGQVACDFFDRLVTSRLVVRLQLARHRGFIYHLHAKALYRALGQVDNRNRRRASAAHIARKLMVLDYVLATPSRDWLATEHDKVAVFTGQFGLASADLPQRRYRSQGGRHASTSRYFVHKLPIALSDGNAAVEFGYLVLDRSGAGLETFLKDHARLLSCLPTWTIVAVCSRHLDGLAACRKVFDRTFRTPPGVGGLPALEDLRWFFKVRLAVERHDLQALSVPDLNRYRELRPQLASASVERLFAAWQVQGDAALTVDDTWRAAPPAPEGKLIGHTLPFAYEQFGSWPGIA